MKKIRLKGKILGFEDQTDYILTDPFGGDSPFRLLSFADKPISFVLVNPYSIFEDYVFEVDEEILEEKVGIKGKIDRLAVMCIVRVEKEVLYVNLRCPLLINTEDGRFAQVVLKNEGYGLKVPFAIKREEKES